MKEFVFNSRSKSDYDWMLEKIRKEGIKYFTACSDDWNCQFQIVYESDKEFVLYEYQ